MVATPAQTQGRNIRHYANYLAERARAFRDTRTDWVRAPESRLERLSVEKGLLRETETVQHQISALVKCDVSKNHAPAPAPTDIRGRFSSRSPKTKSPLQYSACSSWTSLPCSKW